MTIQQLFLHTSAIFKALLLTLCLALLFPTSALACGGLFTFSGQTKVSQETERLLISIGNKNTTLYEQIRYHGNAHDFAWILPVAAVPQVDTASPDLFDKLDDITSPDFYLPEALNCDYADITKTLFGHKEYGAPAPARNSGVEVYKGGNVGPFAYQVIRSGDAQALTSWLKDHQYAIPPTLPDLIRPYVQNHMYFLAMRLRSQGDVSNIAPVKITFPMVMQQVTVPIRLAAADIQKQMKMEVSIIAPQRFGPQNYQDLNFQPDNIAAFSYDPNAQYYQLADTAIQKSGGYGVITQFAFPGMLSRLEPYLPDIPSTDYITRFYTSYTPEHMQIDPVFVAKPELPTVHTLITLKDTSAPHNCTPTYLKSAAILTAFLVIPFIVLLVGGIWLWRRRKTRSDKGSV